LRIRIAANGVYRLDRAALQRAGVPVETVDPRTLRLFAGPLVPEVGWAALGWIPVQDVFGSEVVASRWEHVYERPDFTRGFGPGSLEEVAILVEGAEDARLDAGDQVVFYALGPDNFRDRFGLPLDTAEDYLSNPYTDHTVCWLAWGGTFAEPAKRMTRVDAATRPGAPAVEAGRARVHVELNEIDDLSMYEGGIRWEEWFWDRFDSDGPARRKQVALPHLVPGTALDARVRLWGARMPYRECGWT
jgi:hypothetical protein